MMIEISKQYILKSDRMTLTFIPEKSNTSVSIFFLKKCIPFRWISACYHNQLGLLCKMYSAEVMFKGESSADVIL